MPRLIILGSHSKFLTTVLSLSPQGCSPAQRISAEGQVQSLTEVSDLRVGIQGVTLQLQGRSRRCLSRCAEQNTALGLCLYTVQGCHEVLGLSLDVPGFWLPGVASDVVVMLTKLF